MRDAGDRLLSSDWAALGRLVRRRTLEAVAGHFARLGRSAESQTGTVRPGHGRSASASRGLKPAARDTNTNHDPERKASEYCVDEGGAERVADGGVFSSGKR
ncbi:MAG: hypothetical protein D6788_11010 [Planctomycetota bacterium]|nr:MAG: hypothetical protein D6788_11010 [Planctomycetota bacterium]